MLYDCHCHLGFLPETTSVSHALGENVFALSASVDGADHASALARFGDRSQVICAPGLHPWYVDGDPGRAEAQVLGVLGAIGPGSAVGEVGLDFGPKHAATRAAQLEAFRTIAGRVAGMGECAMTIHSVQATAQVLQVLDEAGFWEHNRALFHWFSGSGDHLQQALQHGAYFSINPRMLLTKRGREYAKAIPASRLLLETDLPDTDGVLEAPLSQVLATLVADLAALRGVAVEQLEARLEENSQRALGTCLSR